MKVNREKTQDELDSEIPHDHDHAPVSESPDTSPAAPEETTNSAAQTETPLIGDYDSTGTTIKPIC
jgi:hypothetical protein